MVNVLLLFPLVSHKLHIVSYKAYMFIQFLHMFSSTGREYVLATISRHLLEVN